MSSVASGEEWAKNETSTVSPTPWGHHYVNVESMPWTPSRIPLSEQKTLYEDPESGRSTVLFRLQPGAVIPFHEHPELEQTFVLKGKLVDHLGECTAGNFVWRAGGSRHTATCPDGAEMIVFFSKPPKRL
jgi:quercetin dioxygenase-like cupin family protein